MALGILTRSGRSLPGLPRFTVADLHRTASLTAVGLVAVHVTTLLLDPYAQLRVLDLLWPFQGRYRPVYLGLGTLALDLLLVVIATSLLRHRLGPRAFHAVHWAVYALWPLALLHGLSIGTDAPTAWFTAVAAGCAGVVAAAVLWRIRPAFAERGHTRIIREARPR